MIKKKHSLNYSQRNGCDEKNEKRNVRLRKIVRKISEYLRTERKGRKIVKK